MLSAFFASGLKYLCGGLLFLTLVMGIALKVERVHSGKLANRVTELQNLRDQDRRNTASNAQLAELLAQQNITRVQAEQQRITANVQSDYARQLAALRARFVRSPKADPGLSQGPTVPAPGSAAPGIDGATGERLSAPERQIAAEISLRLRALQEWIRRQTEVDPNR